MVMFLSCCAPDSNRCRSFHPQPDHVSRNQILHHMAAPVVEFTRIDAVQGVFLDDLRGSHIAVYRGDPAISRNIVSQTFEALIAGPCGGSSESAGGAHRAEGARRHHIHVAGRIDISGPPHDVDHLLGGHDDALPCRIFSLISWIVLLTLSFSWT